MKKIGVMDFALNSVNKVRHTINEGDLLFIERHLAFKLIVTGLHRHIRRTLSSESHGDAKEQDHPLVAAKV